MQNAMSVNITETNYIICHRTLNLYLTYSQLLISQVYKTKYLGLNISNDLSWNDHINHAARVTSSMSGMLWRMSRIIRRSILYKICLH